MINVSHRGVKEVSCVGHEFGISRKGGEAKKESKLRISVPQKLQSETELHLCYVTSLSLWLSQCNARYLIWKYLL